MREPCQIRRCARMSDEPGDRPAVQIDASVRRKRILNGNARELMSERDASGPMREHPGGKAFVQPVARIACERLEEPELAVLRHHRDRLEHRPRRRAQARQPRMHGVSDRARDLSAPACQHLCDKERVSRSLAVQLVRVDAVRLSQRRDRRPRQRQQLEPTYRLAGRELTEHDPERVGGLQRVVTITGDDQRRNRFDPTTDQPQDVERRLVGPVNVLEHDDSRRPLVELAQQRARDLMRLAAPPGELLERATHGLGDIEQRPQGARSEQRIASTPEDAHRTRGVRRRTVAGAPSCRRLPRRRRLRGVRATWTGPWPRTRRAPRGGHTARAARSSSRTSWTVVRTWLRRSSAAHSHTPSGRPPPQADGRRSRWGSSPHARRGGPA